MNVCESIFIVVLFELPFLFIVVFSFMVERMFKTKQLWRPKLYCAGGVIMMRKFSNFRYHVISDFYFFIFIFYIHVCIYSIFIYMHLSFRVNLQNNFGS